MDVTQALKDAENSLRDFIYNSLYKKYKEKWIDELIGMMGAERIEAWRNKMEQEKAKYKFGTPDGRLIYYADLVDLFTIIGKNWDQISDFQLAFKSLKDMQFYGNILNNYRITDAHRRELLPFQRNLVLGICGDIRNRIILYRSSMETPDSYFPRIESVIDSIGNQYIPSIPYYNGVHTKQTLRVGDTITFIIKATDPKGEKLLYKVWCTRSLEPEYSSENEISYTLTEKDRGVNVGIYVYIKSSRDYHALDNRDEEIQFFYLAVLPAK